MTGNRVASIVLVVLVVLCVGTHQATINYCDVLHNSLLFYEAQRSGRLPPTNRIPWRGNSALGDCTATNCVKDSNGDGNLAGGYYDAGDGVKFGLPAAWSLTVLGWGLLEFKPAVSACGELSYYLDALKWGLDWWIKAHPSANELWGQVGNGDLDHAFWGPPEMMTMNRPAYALTTSKGGTELTMEVASAFAAGSLVFAAAGNTAYAATLKTHATQLWDFGNNYQVTYTSSITDAYNFYNSWSGYNDEIVWGSAWLYRLTADSKYLTKAEAGYSEMPNKASANSFDWDNKAPGAIVLLAKLTGKSTYVSDANNWLNWWKPGSNNVPYTPGGMAWIRQWGPCRYTANTAFLAAVMSGSTANTWAQSQINYMLGVNSKSQSFVVGYGPNPPKNPHHRASHGSTTNDINTPSLNKYSLVGALVGGPSQSDVYTDSRTDYISNEVALDYNAGFTGAVAALASWYPSGWTGNISLTTSSGSSSTTGSSSGSCGAGVAAAAGCSGLKFKLNENCNSQWIAFGNPVYGVEAAVSTFEIKDSGSNPNWATMKYETWGAWSFSAPSLTAPLSLRVNLCNGVQYVLTNVFTSITANAEFCGIPPSGTTSTTAKSTTGATTATTKSATTSATTSTTKSATTTATTSTTKSATTAATTTTTAKSTTGTTGSSSTTGSANPNVVVYTDSFLNGFVGDRSWGSTRNFAYTTNPNTGSKTIAFTVDGAWGALYIYKDDGINTATVKGLEFYIRRAATGTGADLKVNLCIQSASVTPAAGTYVLTASSITTTYKKVYVDFDAIGVPAGVYDGFWLQDNVGAAQPMLLIDDITLIGR